MNSRGTIFLFAFITIAIGNAFSQDIEEIIPGEETVQDDTQTSTSYASRFKDADDCEDACEDDCEDACESKCGNDDDCEDACEDACDERCEQDCETLEPAYGPKKGSILFPLSFSYMFHNSRISAEEDRFLRETDMHMIYVNKDNQPVDTVKIDYGYTTFSGNVGVQYYLSDRIGLGLMYEFMQTTEEISNMYEQSYGTLINANTAAFTLTGYPMQKKRIGLSINAYAGVILGSLYRFPLMYEDAEEQNYMTADEEAFVRAIHEKVTLSGFAFSLKVCFHYMINRFMTVYGGPRYVYRYLVLTNDSFTGYPRTANSNDFGINVNFGFLVFGKK
ncbi:MAG: hypothetical protein GF410_06045 [Chitinivibrionales bacterium]|nr:hypothetical protein [Chitinivibrionales bacterium]